MKVYILLQNFLLHNDPCMLFYTTKIFKNGFKIDQWESWYSVSLWAHLQLEQVNNSLH